MTFQKGREEGREEEETEGKEGEVEILMTLVFVPMGKFLECLL